MEEVIALEALEAILKNEQEDNEEEELMKWATSDTAEDEALYAA